MKNGCLPLLYMDHVFLRMFQGHAAAKNVLEQIFVPAEDRKLAAVNSANVTQHKEVSKIRTTERTRRLLFCYVCLHSFPCRYINFLDMYLQFDHYVLDVLNVVSDKGKCNVC